MEFPVQEKDFNKIEVKNNKCINMFGYENGLVFPIYLLDQTFGDSMNLLFLIDDDDSQCRNWIRSSLFQLSNEKSNKSQIAIKKSFSINFIRDWCFD